MPESMKSLAVFASEGPASHDLAFEDDLLGLAAGGVCGVLVASWPGPVVVLGYAQPPGDVDLPWCRAHAIPVLRRLSGGTGVIHHADLGVSLVLPPHHPWSGGILGLYDRFLCALAPALAEVGSRVERVAVPRRGAQVRSPICFEDQLADTLVVGSRKAVGCSQTRRKGGVLIHAAVLLGLDAGLYGRVFGVGEDRVRRALAPAVTGVPWRTVADAIVRRLASALDLEPSWRVRPAPAAGSLARYRCDRWAPVADGEKPRPRGGLV
jgi:lipoate-protein ligase A